MTVTDDPAAPGTAALAAALLEDEARRQQAAAEAGDGPEPVDAGTLIGVGGDALSLRQVVQSGGYSTLAVLFGLNLVDEFEKVALAVLGPDVQRSLNLSDAGLTLVGGVGAFTVVLAAIPFGMLADRRGRTALLGVTSLVWSVAALVSGLVTAAWQLALTRLAIGVGKGNYPVATSVLADRYPVAGRARIFAAHNLANPVANLLAPLLAGGIAALFGWRAAFVVLALPCVLLALCCFALRDPERGANERATLVDEQGEALPDLVADPVPFAAAFDRVRRIRTFNALMTALGAIGLGIAGLPVLFNLFLEQEYGLGSFGRGVVSTCTALGGIVGLTVGARFADRLFREDPAKVLRLGGACLALFGVLYPVSLYMPSPALLVAVQVPAGALAAVPFTVVSTIVASVVPYRLRGFAFAVVGIYLVFVGALLGGVVTGLLSDELGERAAMSTAVPVAFGLAGAYVWSASRHVLDDMAAVVAELAEERDEAARAEQDRDDELLQVRNLDVSYGPVQVLFEVDLVVRRGEVLALLGTNGAGKSTLLRAISGLTLPQRGVVRFGGRAVTFTDATERVRRGIVQVPGGKAVFPSLSVRDNLLAGAYTFVWDGARLERRSAEVLDLFPRLRERLDQPAGTLSGGEQQMLALAKALLLEPEILLIDELSLGLAPVMVQEILQTIDVLRSRGVTMVVVEQSLNVALSISDRAVFMEKGRVRFEGPAAELLERDDLARAVFLGGEGG